MGNAYPHPPLSDYIPRVQVPGAAVGRGPDGDAVVRPFGSGPVDTCLLGQARPPGLHGECGGFPAFFLCFANIERGNKKM